MTLTNTVAVGAFTLEAFFYGIYVGLFGYTTYLLWKRRQHSTRGTITVIGGALCLLFMLATAHMIMSLCLLFLDVLTAPTMSGQFLSYRGSAMQLSVISKAVWVAVMVVADSLVAWRCWVLWNRRPWLIPTFCLLELSFVVCAIGHTITTIQKPSNVSINNAIMAWYICLNITTITTNVLASGLISFRIYQAGHQATRVGGRIRAWRYRSLLWIYLESGSIYPTVLIIALVLYFSDLPFGWLLIVNSTQICGMMPTLMILIILSAGRPLSESTAMDSDTDHNSYIMRTQSRQSNANQLVATETLHQLTIIESVPELQVHVAQEEYKPTRLISFHDVS